MRLLGVIIMNLLVKIKQFLLLSLGLAVFQANASAPARAAKAMVGAASRVSQAASKLVAAQPPAINLVSKPIASICSPSLAQPARYSGGFSVSRAIPIPSSSFNLARPVGAQQVKVPQITPQKTKITQIPADNSGITPGSNSRQAIQPATPMPVCKLYNAPTSFFQVEQMRAKAVVGNKKKATPIVVHSVAKQEVPVQAQKKVVPNAVEDSIVPEPITDKTQENNSKPVVKVRRPAHLSWGNEQVGSIKSSRQPDLKWDNGDSISIDRVPEVTVHNPVYKPAQQGRILEDTSKDTLVHRETEVVQPHVAQIVQVEEKVTPIQQVQEKKSSTKYNGLKRMASAEPKTVHLRSAANEPEFVPEVDQALEQQAASLNQEPHVESAQQADQVSEQINKKLKKYVGLKRAGYAEDQKTVHLQSAAHEPEFAQDRGELESQAAVLNIAQAKKELVSVHNAVVTSADSLQGVQAQKAQSVMVCENNNQVAVSIFAAMAHVIQNLRVAFGPKGTLQGQAYAMDMLRQLVKKAHEQGFSIGVTTQETLDQQSNNQLMLVNNNNLLVQSDGPVAVQGADIILGASVQGLVPFVRPRAQDIQQDPGMDIVVIDPALVNQKKNGECAWIYKLLQGACLQGKGKVKHAKIMFPHASAALENPKEKQRLLLPASEKPRVELLHASDSCPQQSVPVVAPKNVRVLPQINVLPVPVGQKAKNRDDKRGRFASAPRPNFIPRPSALPQQAMHNPAHQGPIVVPQAGKAPEPTKAPKKPVVEQPKPKDNKVPKAPVPKKAVQFSVPNEMSKAKESNSKVKFNDNVTIIKRKLTVIHEAIRKHGDTLLHAIKNRAHMSTHLADNVPCIEDMISIYNRRLECSKGTSGIPVTAFEHIRKSFTSFIMDIKRAIEAAQ